MQRKENKKVKKLAPKQEYISPLQMKLSGFSTPFETALKSDNRWVKMAHLIPWDSLVNLYQGSFKSTEGRPPINGRIIIGSLIIKHINNLTDRETIEQICENVYLQYFLGYSSFITEPPFTAPLFVEIRKRLSEEGVMDKIHNTIAIRLVKEIHEKEATSDSTKMRGDSVKTNTNKENKSQDVKNYEQRTATKNSAVRVDSNETKFNVSKGSRDIKVEAEEVKDRTDNDLKDVVSDIKVEAAEVKDRTDNDLKDVVSDIEAEAEEVKDRTDNDLEQATNLGHRGQLIVDATVAPQNITYPTDLKVLNAARIKSEELIDKLHKKQGSKIKKVRTYRQKARQQFLAVAKKKRKSKTAVRRGIGQQLGFLHRNIKHIDRLLLAQTKKGIISFDKKDVKYLETIKKVYEQQEKMYKEKSHQVEHRIVNIHQPYVRPIVRGKDGCNVEFGSKINVSLVEGFAFIDKFSWEPFNEGLCLQESVNKYKERFGFYPKTILADQIYCNRENRQTLKTLGITLKAKPLGRPSKIENPDSAHKPKPGERNPIEGKFGQAKTKYGLNLVKAKLDNTSETWVYAIIMVVNLIKILQGYNFWLNFTLHFYNNALKYCFWLIQQLKATYKTYFVCITQNRTANIF